MSENSEIRALVDDFAEKLSALVRQSAVNAAIDALRGGSPAPVRRGPGRPPRSASAAPAPRPSAGGKGTRVRRTLADIQKTMDRVADYVSSHDAVRAEDIKKALKLTSAQNGDALRRLVDTKVLKTKGERRATTYSKS
jgi:hypothetical protein